MIKLLLVFIICCSAYAQNEYQSLIQEILPEVDLPNAEYQILRRDMRLNSLIIESIKDIQLNGGEIRQMGNATSSLKRTVLLAADARSIQLGERLHGGVKDILETSVSPTKMRAQIGRFVQFIQRDLARKGVNLSNYTRRFGMQVGLYYLVAMQVDYTVPLVLIASGNVKLGAALFSMPFSSTTTALFASARSVMRYRHLLKELGFNATRENYRIFKQIKSYFDRSFFGTDYLVDMNVSGLKVAVTVEESTLFRRVVNRLGYKNALSYQNLVDFLNEKGLYQELIRNLNPNNHQMKLALTLKILRQIELDGNTEAISMLQKRFGTKISIMEGLVSLDTHKTWFAKLANSQNMDELFRLMGSMPDDLAPKTFSKVWRDYVLPNLSNSFGNHTDVQHFKSFRNLYNRFDRDLLPILALDNTYSINNNIKSKISDYLYEAFTPLNSCGHVFKGPRSSALVFFRLF